MLAHNYFENKLPSPSTEDEGDLDVDYDYQEVRSFDRSSAGSIPWAEDAIKQNQQEWERVESYFYNESVENLPTDDKELCREILEWRRFFSHSNNIEKHKKEYQTKNFINKKFNESDAESDDETLVENSTSSTLKSNKVPLRNMSVSKNNQNEFRLVEKQSAKSVNFPMKMINNSTIKSLSKNFAKDLRISSVPRNNKRTSITQNNTFIPTAQNLQPQAIPIKVIQRHYPHPNQFYPSQSAKYLLEKYPNSIVTIEKKISPHSATYSRMPPVYNLLRTGNTKIIPIYNQSYQFQSRYGTSRAVGRNKRSQVVLPALNSVHSNEIPSTSNLRSISAINSKNYDNRQIKNISALNRIEYLPSLSASNEYKYRP